MRGEVWAVDFEPQTHKQEPGNKERPALVIQTDALNRASHPTTIIIPGTSRTESLPPGDSFPLRVRIQKSEDLKYDTDLLIDQDSFNLEQSARRAPRSNRPDFAPVHSKRGAGHPPGSRRR